MSFAPYQDQSPERHRTLSPTPPLHNDDRPSHSPSGSHFPPSPVQSRGVINGRLDGGRSSQPQPVSRPAQDPWHDDRSALPDPGKFDETESHAGLGAARGAYGVDGRGQAGPREAEQEPFTLGRRDFLRAGENVFKTSLGIRMEIEAAAAYLALPPAGGVVLLVFERDSDYVR